MCFHLNSKCQIPITGTHAPRLSMPILGLRKYFLCLKVLFISFICKAQQWKKGKELLCLNSLVISMTCCIPCIDNAVSLYLNSKEGKVMEGHRHKHQFFRELEWKSLIFQMLVEANIVINQVKKICIQRGKSSSLKFHKKHFVFPSLVF